MTKILGAILSGGGAVRFGSDKLLADMGGVPLIAHVIARLTPQVDEVVLVGRGYAGLSSLPDRPVADIGPLGGLNSALHYAKERGFDAVLMVPGDAPDLPYDLAAMFGDWPAYASDSPVTGLWPSTLAPVLDAWLATENKRAVAAFGDSVSARAVAMPKPIVNINTRQDYAAFLGR
jgi:molybdenum cofactor guanylyltransferase